MEALTSDQLASPALHQITLDVLATVDTWAADPAWEALARLVERADDADVAHIPASIGAVLPLLAGDRSRVDVALDAVARFDLHEAAAGVAVLVWRGVPDGVLAGAALVPHPGVPQSFRDLVGAHAADLGEEWQRRLFRVRVDPGFEPSSDHVAWERAVRWLSPDPSTSRFAAALLEPPSERLSARDHFRLLLDLVAAGVVVRRMPTMERPAPPWAPAWAPRIGAYAHTPRFAAASPVSALERRRIIERVFRLTPHAWRASRLPTTHERLSPPELSTIQVFDDGALPRREVAYLSGLRGRQFDRLHRYENLRPLRFRGVNYWTFGQVVGLRAASYLFRLSGRRTRLATVADRLVGLARTHDQVPVAITQTGNVLVKEDDVLYDVESGQVVDEGVVSLVDQVYEPFVLDGATVPRLLRPAQHVAVHPGVVRGLPCVTESRVSVRAVASILQAARVAGKADAVAYASDVFGIDESKVVDAERVAHAVSAVA